MCFQYEKDRPWMTLNSRKALYCRRDACFRAHHKILDEGRSILSL